MAARERGEIIRMAVADATVLLDNSREEASAFTVCRTQVTDDEVYDLIPTLL